MKIILANILKDEIPDLTVDVNAIKQALIACDVHLSESIKNDDKDRLEEDCKDYKEMSERAIEVLEELLDRYNRVIVDTVVNQ